VNKLQLNFERVFANTITSYSPTVQGVSSGLTGSDVERILAFHELGKVDPIDYVEDWNTVVERALRLESEFRTESQTDA
ncbi:MAG: hypothetical protein AAGA30_16875, partial [Planctomycetota bacterium]